MVDSVPQESNVLYFPVFYSPIDLGEIFTDVTETKWYRVDTKYPNVYKYIVDTIYEQEQEDSGPETA